MPSAAKVVVLVNLADRELLGRPTYYMSQHKYCDRRRTIVVEAGRSGRFEGLSDRLSRHDKGCVKCTQKILAEMGKDGGR